MLNRDWLLSKELSLENLSVFLYKSKIIFSLSLSIISNLDLKLKGNAVSVYSKLYSSASEITELTGTFKTGKKPDININCK